MIPSRANIESVATRVSEDTVFSKVRLNLSNIKATLLPTPRLTLPLLTISYVSLRISLQNLANICRREVRQFGPAVVH